MTLNGLRILLVEDNADFLDLLALTLAIYGAKVATAASASQALDIYAQFQPELLICDIAMPEADGYTLLRQLRNRQAPNSAPTLAIALSGMSGSDQHAAAMAAGFQLYLTKPCDLEQLIGIVAQLGERISTN